MNKEFLTIAEASDLLGVHVATLRRWDMLGKLKAKRHPINNFRIYSREDIVLLVQKIGGK